MLQNCVLTKIMTNGLPPLSGFVQLPRPSSPSLSIYISTTGSVYIYKKTIPFYVPHNWVFVWTMARVTLFHYLSSLKNRSLATT